jgi:hypothetical protein
MTVQWKIHSDSNGKGVWSQLVVSPSTQFSNQLVSCSELNYLISIDRRNPVAKTLERKEKVPSFVLPCRLKVGEPVEEES